MTLSPTNTDQLAACENQRPAPPTPIDPDVPHAVYLYDVDEVTFEFDQATITGAQVMSAAGIPEADGIIQVHEDGTRDTVTATTLIHLVSGAHFKRRPRFKRG